MRYLRNSFFKNWNVIHGRVFNLILNIVILKVNRTVKCVQSFANSIYFLQRILFTCYYKGIAELVQLSTFRILFTEVCMKHSSKFYYIFSHQQSGNFCSIRMFYFILMFFPL